MSADKYLQTACDPDRWFAKSKELQLAADNLWQLVMKEWSQLFNSGPMPDEAQSVFDEQIMPNMSAAQLLYGLAIEAGLKARLIQDLPSKVEFTATMSGDASITSVTMKKIGSTGHNLTVLATEVGLLKDASFRRQNVDMLNFLSDCITWRSRYPVPLDSRNVKYERPQGITPVKDLVIDFQTTIHRLLVESVTVLRNLMRQREPCLSSAR